MRDADAVSLRQREGRGLIDLKAAACPRGSASPGRPSIDPDLPVLDARHLKTLPARDPAAFCSNWTTSPGR